MDDRALINELILRTTGNGQVVSFDIPGMLEFLRRPEVLDALLAGSQALVWWKVEVWQRGAWRPAKIGADVRTAREGRARNTYAGLVKAGLQARLTRVVEEVIQATGEDPTPPS